jgi:integrase
MTNLTSKKIESLLRAGHQGRVLDGEGLRLQCRGKGKDGQGRASWLLRYTVRGRVRELGLGSIKAVSLAQARAAAAQAKAAVFKGDDPIAAKHMATAKPTSCPTFGFAAEAFWETNQPRWRNLKVRALWLPFMRRHAAALWAMPVGEVGRLDMLKVIEPLWSPKRCSAKRLMERCGQVLDFSRVKGWRTADTPRHRGTFEYVLPKAANINVRHHPALPLPQLPALMARLEALPGTAALAFRLAILTACRAGEVYGATWDEVNLGTQLWTIPAARYKTGKAHQVPLSSAAMQVLSACPRFTDNPFVFPSPTKARAPLSNMAIIVLLKRMGIQTTAHGTARSTFADWAADHTDFDFEVREGCLGHTVGTAVTRAYRRGDALLKRRALLELWGQTIAPQGVVVPFKAANQLP